MDNENTVGNEIPEAIREIEERLERLRKDIDKYANYSRIVIISMFSVLGLILIGAIQTGIMFPTYIVIIGGVIILMAIRARRDSVHNAYRMTYKNEFVKKVLEEELEEVHYDWMIGFKRGEIELKQVIEMGDIYESEDFLSAEYKGVGFRRSDIYMANKDSDSTPITTFRGRVYDIEFNKRILGELQVRTKIFPHGVTSQCLKRTDNIETENIEFNDTFDIRSTDEEEAFYVLTPHMQEHILNINNNFENMCIKIEGSRLFIMGSTKKSSFELSLKEQVIFENERYNILRELREIKNIIDEMNLMDRQFLQIREENQYTSTYHEKLNAHVVDKSTDEMFIGDIG